MDGHSGQAGAVAGVTTIKNPITAARAVLLHSPHVLLIGAGAERFAAEQQLVLVDHSYFHTPLRAEQLRLAQAKDQIQLDHSPAFSVPVALWETDHKFGTVGAVALDQHGNLAAGTSTGGMTNKRYGRVGDSPIIGAGTFADNTSAAVSCTGTGEFFMRGVVAYDIAARMKYAGSNLSEAVAQAIDSALTQRGGSGGVIALDAAGNIQFGFNTEGMYRGYIRSDGQPVALIFKDE
jgi:beta-aspartyl-peptidase (threonine type)